MMHVKQIRDVVDEGRTEEAHDALDQLLALGPNNLEALKLRARLYEFEGRFAEEAKVWDKVTQVDREDPDAVQYLMRRQLEDREHFYFTDDLPGGGRKFMAYPRGLINSSAMGLLGCLAFLVSTRFASDFPLIAEPPVLLTLFVGFVILPWLGILASYLTSIRSVAVSSRGVAVATRLKQYEYAWGEIEKVCLARTSQGGTEDLSLVFLPKDRTAVPVEIDLNQGSSPIRARTYLVREIARSFAEPEYARREELGLAARRTARF